MAAPKVRRAQTHFTIGPAGAPAGDSYWAAVITSSPVTITLLSELGAHAQQLAQWAAQLSVTGSIYAGIPVEANVALRTASRWLEATDHAASCCRSR
jgi:hypothetical protein